MNYSNLNIFRNHEALNYIKISNSNVLKLEFSKDTYFNEYVGYVEKTLNCFIDKMDNRNIYLKILVATNIDKPEILFGNQIFNEKRISRWLTTLSGRRIREMDIVFIIPTPMSKNTPIDNFFVLFNSIHLLSLLVIYNAPDTIKDNLYLSTARLLISKLKGEESFILNLWTSLYNLWIQNKILLNNKIEKKDFLVLEINDVMEKIDSKDPLSGYFIKNFNNHALIDFDLTLPTDLNNLLDYSNQMNSLVLLKDMVTMGNA
jgi:hypothetical protein